MSNLSTQKSNSFQERNEKYDRVNKTCIHGVEAGDKERIIQDPEEITKIIALISKHKRGEKCPIFANIREPKTIRVQLYNNGDEFVEEIIGQIKPASFEPIEEEDYTK